MSDYIGRYRIAIFVTLGYLLVGLAWISLSDRLLFGWFRDPDILTRLQTLRGYLFGILSMACVGLVAVIASWLSHKLFRQQNAIVQLELHLKQLLDTVHEAILLVDRQGIIRFASIGAAELLGQDPDLLVEHRFSHFLAKRDRARFEESGKLELTELTFLHPEGRKTLDASANEYTCTDHEMFRMVHLHDPLQRSETQRELMQEKRTNDALLEALPGLFYMLDESLRFQRWNSRVEDATGYTAGEIGSITPFELMGGHPRRLRELIDSVFAGEISQGEGCITRKDGRHVPYLFTGRSMNLFGRKYIIGIGIDISEQRRIEQSLHASEVRFRNIFSSTPAGTLVLDSLCRIEDVNPAFCDMLGYQEFELIRVPVNELLHDNICTPEERVEEPRVEERDRIAATLNQYARDGMSWEQCLHRKDGREVWLRFRAAQLPNPDSVSVSILLIATDITEMRKYERKMREYAQRLEDVGRRHLENLESERKEIARELHDDVGQRLTAVRLSLRNALDTNEKERRIMMISHAANEVGDVLEAVRELSRNLRPSTLDDFGLEGSLRWLVDRVMTVLEEPPETVIEVCEIKKKLDPLVETTCFRIAQESLNNCVKYAAATRIEVSVAEEPAGIKLVIRDNGMGFDVNAQLDRAMRGGSFGLVGMQERAKLAGGQLVIESRVGEGTSVVVWLPFTSMSQPDCPEALPR